MKKGNYAHLIFLSLNWIFGLLFLLAGIDAFFESRAGGLSFILISLLLLPPVRVLVFSLTHKEIQMGRRSLYITLLVFSFVFFMVNDKKQQPLNLETRSTVPVNSIKQNHENKNIFENNSTGIQTKSQKTDKLPRKVILVQSPNTKEANQIKNNKSNSEIKSNNILEKLKNIPASQYELNRSLYQQLVNFNPDNNKFKKKLSFYSKKIKQQSRNTAKKNAKLMCKNIRINKTVSFSPNWLLDNGHCLSKNLKKKMEIELVKEVKQIPSKKIKQNWKGYKSLSILNPNNKTYLKKLEHYKNKLKLRTAKN